MNIVMLLSKSLRTDHRVYREAAALRDAGHDVTVVEWARHEPDAPERELVEDIRVQRVHDRGIAGFLPGTILREPFWWHRAARVVDRLHGERPVDVVHCHDLDTLPAGVRAKRRIGCRLVFDAHEIFADMLVGHQPAIVVRAARSLERRLLPHVDHIIAPTERSVAHYRTTQAAPVTLVANAFGPAPADYTPPPATPFTITYIGILSHDRLFPQVVDTLGRTDGTRFVIGGKREGVWREVETHAEAHPSVTFLGTVPFGEVHERTRSGHAVLCMLDPANPQYQVTPATKLYDGMSCGRPIVTSIGTHMGDFVTRHDVGIACAYDAAAVAHAVATLRDDPEACERMGRNGIHLAQAEHNWARQSIRLLDAYASLEPTAAEATA